MPDSTRTVDVSDTTHSTSELHRLFELQKKAYHAEPYPSREVREGRLDALMAAIEENEAAIIAAINDDFGNRAAAESMTAEILVSIGAIRANKKHLKKWMASRSVATPLTMFPAKSRVEPQPLGIVGIISPWNYPIQLAVSPLAAAIAAGNRVLIKPSELTQRTSDLLKKIIASKFAEDVCAVVTGGADVGQAFSEIPFDHLLFTGSTKVGGFVYQAAARNLTPVTLELGGKSPAIIDASADLEKAAGPIAHGKLYNAGQTCVAPDYVLTPSEKMEATIEALTKAARGLFPEIDTTTDYTSIVSDHHFKRLHGMIEEARNAGTRIVEVGSSNALNSHRKLPFTMVIDPSPDLKIMQEEIFGPVLPILGVSGENAVIDHINSGDRPLALYWFGEDDNARDRILRQTVSGGVTVNDTLWHVAQENLPFGGVGKSGIGSYHGTSGFETFSHMKPVFYQSSLANGALLHPPYTEKTKKIMKLVKKFI